MIRAGGWALIVAAVLFVAVFTWLAMAFDYPAVLDGPGAAVLPALMALGTTGRAVWSLYALLPLALIPAGLAVAAAFGERSPGAARMAAVAAFLAAIAMMLGLLRWPSIHWTLAAHLASAASAAERASIIAVFDGLNSYLGQFIGEFVGELALNTFFFFAAFAGRPSGAVPRWAWPAGAAVAVVGWLGMWRNVTAMAAPFTAVDNYLLPLWMMVLGVLLVRAGRVSPTPPAAPPPDPPGSRAGPAATMPPAPSSRAPRSRQ